MTYTRHVNQRYINSITTFKHSWPDYGAKIKDNPTCDMVPITPNWAPLLIIRKGNIVSLRVLVELPLELILVTWSGSTWTCIWSYSIYEPQGLSNLTPLRSGLLKLIGRVRQHICGAAASD